MLQILKTKRALFGLPQQRKMKQAIPFQLRLDRYCRWFAGHGSVNLQLQEPVQISRKLGNVAIRVPIVSFKITFFRLAASRLSRQNFWMLF
jgi:hypothetical protein